MSSRHDPPIQGDAAIASGVSDSSCFLGRFDIFVLPSPESVIYSSAGTREHRIACDFLQIFAVDRVNVVKERARTMDTTQNDPVLRDCRRHQLALRLMAHQARTRTITALTNLSRHQLAKLRQRCRIPEATRHRGPSPRSLSRFTHSPRARSEGAALAAFCRAYRVIPARTSERTRRRNRMTLEFGERLCATYEAYLACFPHSDVEIEELLSLVLGISENGEISLGCCPLCSGTVLIDHLARHGPVCSHCHGVLADGQTSLLAETCTELSSGE